MTPKQFAKAVKRAAFARADGHCEGCGAVLVAPYHYDHVIPIGLGGHSVLANCALLCKPCHDAKTRVRDIPAIAKALRIAEKAKAMRPSSRPLPAGRDSPLKRTLSGAVIPRVTPSEAHREFMSRRYGVIRKRVEDD